MVGVIPALQAGSYSPADTILSVTRTGPYGCTSIRAFLLELAIRPHIAALCHRAGPPQRLYQPLYTHVAFIDITRLMPLESYTTRGNTSTPTAEVLVIVVGALHAATPPSSFSFSIFFSFFFPFLSFSYFLFLSFSFPFLSFHFFFFFFFLRRRRA